MTIKIFKLKSSGLLPVLNVLNEVCHGIKINNFEMSIGIDKSTAVDFMDSLAKEENKREITLNLAESEFFS